MIQSVKQAVGLTPTPPKSGCDEVFTVLENPRRRFAVEVIEGWYPEEFHTISELAEEVAAIEYDVPPGELSGAERKRVYVSLTQSHGKKLVAAGILDPVEEYNAFTRGPYVDWYADTVRRFRGELE